MQIQPEYIWSHQDESMVKIWRDEINIQTLLQITERKNYTYQQIGHPLNAILRQGLYEVTKFEDLLLTTS